MAIMAYNKHVLPTTTRKINETDTANVYLTKNHTMLKKYKLNLNYIKLLALHDNDFKTYLDELSTIESNILLVPNDIYVHGKNAVFAQETDFPLGTLITGLYPKTNLKNLYDALLRMDEEIERLDYLSLQDIKPDEIAYDGTNITLLNLDKCLFADTDYPHNRATVNKAIINGLLDSDDFIRSIRTNPVMKQLFVGVIYGLEPVAELLNEYRKVIEDYTEHRCKYVRDLSLTERRGK